MGQSHRGHGPKSLILIDLCLNHPAAIQYDWIAAWGHPLDLTRQPLYEAWPMCREILKNHDTSHAYAALAGNSYLPGQTEQLIHAFNQSRQRRTTPAWRKSDPLTSREHTAAAQPHNEALRAKLRERLGISGT